MVTSFFRRRETTLKRVEVSVPNALTVVSLLSRIR